MVAESLVAILDSHLPVFDFYDIAFLENAILLVVKVVRKVRAGFQLFFAKLFPTHGIIIIIIIIIILSRLSCLSQFAPERGLGLALRSVFACNLFKRGDRVGYTQSTLLPQQLLGRAVA